MSSVSLPASIVAYWTLNETSLTRADGFGSNHLPEDTTVSFTSDAIVSNAAVFTGANQSSFSFPDNAAMSTGDVDFTFWGWARLTTKTASGPIIEKLNFGANNREYRVEYDQPTDRFRMFVSRDGTNGTATTVNADALGSPAVDTWYFIVAWHDSVDDTINIQINNGTVNSAAHTGGVLDGNSDFEFGALKAGSVFLDGDCDEWGFSKRVLSASERTLLYNKGLGRSLPLETNYVEAFSTVIPAGGGDYTTLSAWEAGEQRDLVGDETFEVVECSAGDVGIMVLAGWITDTCGSIEIRVAEGARHKGIEDTGGSFAYSTTVATDNFDIRVSNVTIRDMIIDGTGTGASIHTQISSSDGLLVEQCIIDRGFDIAGLGSVNQAITLRNSSLVGPIFNRGVDTTLTILNCTIVEVSTDNALTVENGGTITENNNYIAVSTGSVYTVTSGTINQGVNTATSNAEATTASLDNIALDGTNFVDPTGSPRDLHLVTGSALIDQGASQSFTLDFEGGTRGATFDIGADEFGAPRPGASASESSSGAGPGGGVPSHRITNISNYPGIVGGNFMKITDHLKIGSTSPGTQFITVVYREEKNQ